MNRRGFLIAASAAPLVVAPAALVAHAAAPQATASIETQRRYCAFLWAEHCRVAEEMNVDRFDALIFRQDGDLDAVHTVVDLAPPSARADTVLRVLGLHTDDIHPRRLSIREMCA